MQGGTDMEKNITIRPERVSDYQQVEDIIRQAFYNLYTPGCTEHYLAHAIRPHPDFPPIANLDILFIVTSTTQPVPSTLVLDQLAAAAIYKDVQPVLVVTKSDLAAADMLRTAYAGSGIPLVQLNYETGEGLDEVKGYIEGHLCAFCGNSGVGKSTLLNTLAPALHRETGQISQKLGRGRHTTREVEIFEICGGRLADTPGFASLEAQKLCRIPKDDLQHTFPEFGPYFGQCRFTGCSHRSETGCALREAVEAGTISKTRYASYLAMYEEASARKEWEN